MKLFLEILDHSFLDSSVFTPFYVILGLDPRKDIEEHKSFEDISHSYINPKFFQEVLKEPLKFLKNPTYATIALSVLKDPSLELYIKKTTQYHRFFIVTKNSFNTILEETYDDALIEYYKDLEKL